MKYTSASIKIVNIKNNIIYFFCFASGFMFLSCTTFQYRYTLNTEYIWVSETENIFPAQVADGMKKTLAAHGFQVFSKYDDDIWTVETEWKAVSTVSDAFVGLIFLFTDAAENNDDNH
jgi:hypothetical protein